MCVLGIPIFNLRKTWEKILLAARVIATIENPSDVCVLSNRQYGQVQTNLNSNVSHLPSFLVTLCIQWDPSNTRMNGTEESVLFSEISLFLGLKWHGRVVYTRCP